jgi:tetratricopeptide (TPR) repeat protein
MTEGKRMKFNQADKHKGKYPPLSDEMQKLAQEGHQVRHFEIVNEAGSHYKQGIPDEIGEATWMIKTGRLEEAQTALHRIIKREPRAKEAYANLGTLYVRMGDVETAEALFQKAIDKFPRYVFPRASMAMIYLKRGRADQAEAVMRPLDDLERFTWTEFRRYTLAWSDIHAYQHHFKVALSWLKVLSKMLPRSRGLWKRRIIYWMGRLFLEGRGE